jgi:hypothetical protein
MYRLYQMMSNGKGAVAAGAVKLLDGSSVQQYQRDYPVQVADMAGTTGQRPKAGDPDFSIGLPAGIHYLDTTLAIIVVSDGTGLWRNPATGASV